MHSRISAAFDRTPDIDEAETILKRCVHCGFCNATCPTYQLQGDELDGPRGRIYLIKQMLEGEPVTGKTQHHLDRCLTCRSCETTCPSGVEYGRLADIGRHILEQKIRRPIVQRLFRRTLVWWLPYPKRFRTLLRLANLFRPILPDLVQKKLPVFQLSDRRSPSRHARTLLLLDGCVQDSLAPRINTAAAHVLDRLGITAIRTVSAGCCGALNYHNGDQLGGLDFMRRLIDTCWPAIESGAEAIVMTASGCGVMLKDYGRLLRNDAAYAEKSMRFSSLCRDLSEVMAREDLSGLPVKSRRIAFQSPCSLQHGQKLNGSVETLLTGIGFELTHVGEAHLCCGSAGAYSLLQPDIAAELRTRKLSNLMNGEPELIATANIGCLLHLREKSQIPVIHWIELLM